MCVFYDCVFGDYLSSVILKKCLETSRTLVKFLWWSTKIFFQKFILLFLENKVQHFDSTSLRCTASSIYWDHDVLAEMTIDNDTTFSIEVNVLVEKETSWTKLNWLITTPYPNDDSKIASKGLIGNEKLFVAAENQF